jgi:PKD repeat protein
MENGIVKKSFVVAILLLFLGAAVLPNTSADTMTSTQAGETNLLRSDLVGYWALDEGTGTTVHDYSGNGFDGHLDSCNWVSGYSGAALEFPSLQSRVHGISASMDDQITDFVSIEAWVYWYGPGSFLANYIFDCRCYYGGFLFFINDQHKLAFEYYVSSQNIPMIVSVSDVPINTWTHVKAILDTTADSMSLYINDQLDNTISTIYSYSNSYLGGAIGNNRWSDELRPFNGVIDEVMIWKGGEQENIPPFADFNWEPQNPTQGQPIIFDASSSHDLDGSITLYEWDWNNDGMYEESHSSPTATYSWSQVGTYPVTLQVTDNESLTDTVTKEITVINAPPNADFTWTPQNPSHGQVITFDASASSDPDGVIIWYQWDWNNDGVYEENQPGPTTTHLWTNVGSYLIKLQVTDDDGAIDSTTKTITIINLPPGAPSTTGPTHGKLNLMYQWNFTALDPDNDDVSYQIDWGDGTSVSQWYGPFPSGVAMTLSYMYSAEGTYEIKSKAKDIIGDESDWGTFTVIISNDPPSAPSITGPTSGEPNVAYQWDFMALDPDNDDVSYQIDWGDGNLSTWYGPFNSGDVMAQSHVYSAEGTYTIKSKAKDIYGDESDWGTLTVTMPCSVEFEFLHFWELLFQRFPHAFPLLRHLLGY